MQDNYKDRKEPRGLLLICVRVSHSCVGGLEGLLHVCVHCLLIHPRLEHTLGCDQTIGRLLWIENGNTQCETTVCVHKQMYKKGEMSVSCRSTHGYGVPYPQEFSAAPPLALPLLLHLLPGPLLLPSEWYSPPPSNSRPSLARPESPAEIHKRTCEHMRISLQSFEFPFAFHILFLTWAVFFSK